MKKFTLSLILFSVCALFSDAHAQFMCTDIVPDSVVSIAPGATLQLTYDLDVNNDLTADFRFNSVQNGNFGFVIIQATQIGTVNAVLADGSNNALALTAGTPITATNNVWVQMNGNNQTMSSIFGGPPTGNFPGMGDRYLGLRFVVGANTYYGWARFNFSAAVNSYTVKDYGYNATPNASIAAGQACAPPLFAPTFTISSPKCAGNSVTVTANTGTIAASGYTWSSSPAGPTIASPNASPTSITFPNAGTFSITLTATSGTTTANSTNTILVNANPVLTLATTNTILCAGQSATISASGANSYTWSTGSNSTAIAVTPSVTTNYTLTGSSASGCTNSVVFSQSVVVCQGLAQFGSNRHSFSIYPNPASDKIFVAINTTESLDVKIEVIDLMGKIIISQRANFSSKDAAHEINLRNVAKGVYFVKLSSDESSQMIKIIKDQ